MSTRDATSTPGRAGVVSPALTEPAARGFIAGIGGPVNRHGITGRARWWTPLRVLILVGCTTLALGLLSKAACFMGGPSWADGFAFRAVCYNDITPLFGGRGLDRGGDPYAYSWTTDEGETRYLEYPVLTGWFQAVVAALARATAGLGSVAGLSVGHWYFVLTALVLAALWVLTIRITAALAGSRVWDTVLVAASPLVVVHAFTNWDILAVLFAVGALATFARGRFAWSGVLIGLGTAAKLWPLFLLGAPLVLVVREFGRRRNRFPQLAAMLAGAVLSWAAVNAPVWLAHPRAWEEFLRLNRERGAEWTTIYAIIDRIFGHPFGAELLNTLSLALFVLACLAVFTLGVMARRTPRVAELVSLILIAFLLVNKVWSPQYSLWLVVPVVLALPRWRLLFTWMTVDMLVWPAVLYYMDGVGSDRPGIPAPLFNGVVLLRDVLLVVIAVLIVRVILGRAPDPVAAAAGGRDPLSPWPMEQPGRTPGEPPRTTTTAHGTTASSAASVPVGGGSAG